MDILVGVILGLMAVGSSRLVGFDRERSFFPVLLIVIATYYLVFAMMGKQPGALEKETVAAAVFAGIAMVAYKRSLWLVPLGLAAHAIFDVFHGQLIVNPGVPDFWPTFCLGFDLVAAAYLSALLWRRDLCAVKALG